MPYNFLKVGPEIMKAHRISWFGRIQPCAEYPDGYVPRTRYMRGRDWGWDVRCSCGWETHSGGAIEARIREEIQDHRFEAEYAAERGTRYVCKSCGAESTVGIGYVLLDGDEPERSEPASWCRHPHLQARLDSSKETC